LSGDPIDLLGRIAQLPTRAGEHLFEDSFEEFVTEREVGLEPLQVTKELPTRNVPRTRVFGGHAGEEGRAGAMREQHLDQALNILTR